MSKGKHARSQRIDTMARYVIKSSGFLVIASMVAIFVFLLVVVLPLLQSASKHPLGLDQAIRHDMMPLEFGVFSSLDGFYTVSAEGHIIWHSGSQKTVMFEDDRILKTCQVTTSNSFNLAWQDGSISYVEVLPLLTASGHPTVKAIEFEVPPGFEDAEHSIVRVASETLARGIFINPGGHIRSHLYKFQTTEQSISAKDLHHPLKGNIESIALGRKGRWLYVGTSQGELAVWDLESEAETPLYSTEPQALPSRVTSIAMMFGDFSVAVGSATGELQTWGVTPREKGFQLSKLHTLDNLRDGVVKLLPSSHDKTLLILGKEGHFHLDYTTSERRLLTLKTDSDQRLVNGALSKDNRKLLAIDAQGHFYAWQLDLQYSEVSFKTLWRPVWYEGYPGAAYTWQSSAASDAFEPKISLPPLIFGSLKGTFYSMLFALPISLFAAMYVSQLMHPRWRSVIKPIVELMAGLPSVIVGFVAALVLAPILERNLLGLFIIIPTFFLILGTLVLSVVPIKERLEGKEFLLLIPMTVFSVWAAFGLGRYLEKKWFQSHFDLWLFESFGLVVEQRNALVIAIALGFAVMPLIFTIAEDALYNVPRQYTAASLALGSSKWQTLRHVVLPIAKPGILAAVMIGLGRAIGETMIVLMATGNTPVMTMDLFEGMRTLSANIAIEIGEAPAGSMLFRVLFLSALLLFAITFVINTIAEMVRNYLQQKYRQM